MARAVALLLALALCGCGGVAASGDDSRAAADRLGSGADQCSVPVEERAGGWLCPGTGGSLADRYDEAPAWPGAPWTKNGLEVPREELVLAAGPEHCGWQDSAFIGGEALSAPRDEVGPHWVRDPRGVLTFDPRAQAEFRSPAQLPSDAAWTGYAQDGVELWVAPSDRADYVYLVNSTDRSDTERWVRGGGLCA